MTFAVKWGRERLHFILPPPDSRLAVIRRAIADYTHLPEQSFKIIHAGAVMKDDNAPISAYSIRENSTLTIIGTASPFSSAPQPTPSSNSNFKTNQNYQNYHNHHEPKTEQSTITQIRSEVDKVRQTLLPSVDTFLHAIIAFDPAYAHPQQLPQTQMQAPIYMPAQDPAAAAAAAPAAPLTLTNPPSNPNSNPNSNSNSTPEQEHTRLSELLLQSLLRLDAITTDGSWEHARAERKGAVREVQGLLDRLDGGWGRRGGG